MCIRDRHHIPDTAANNICLISIFIQFTDDLLCGSRYANLHIMVPFLIVCLYLLYFTSFLLHFPVRIMQHFAVHLTVCLAVHLAVCLAVCLTVCLAVP